jgi:hypothetical protein
VVAVASAALAAASAVEALGAVWGVAFAVVWAAVVSEAGWGTAPAVSAGVEDSAAPASDRVQKDVDRMV